jgi:hypothetical protein
LKKVFVLRFFFLTHTRVQQSLGAEFNKHGEVLRIQNCGMASECLVCGGKMVIVPSAKKLTTAGLEEECHFGVPILPANCHLSSSHYSRLKRIWDDFINRQVASDAARVKEGIYLFLSI